MPKKRIDILQGVLGTIIVIIAIRMVILIALDITPLADYCFKKYENQQYNEYIYAEGKINEYVLNEISELITQGNMPKALVYYFYKDGGIGVVS